MLRRRSRRPRLAAVAALGLGIAASAADEPALALHPDNPHYFLFRGRPTILITSAEHYGAVLNLDFDWARYLETLAADGMNHTRIFTGGTYVEPPGAFNIASNTLAPGPGRFIAPWARSAEPGYAGGGNRFDLGAWNDDYFARLRDFVAEAGRRGIVVEVNLFCPFYEAAQWKLSPLHPDNNTNGLGAGIAPQDVYTLDRSGPLLGVQERMARKFVEELRGFDNIFYEVCNEPYFGGVALDWHHHMASVIHQAQEGHEHPKLVSWNVANGSAPIADPPAAYSIFNFHYAAPPDAVGVNYGLNRVIGDNETGFRGTGDAAYRMEAWDFLIAGGGLFNHLDYSFAVGHEDGTFAYPETQPGGGGASLRRQLRTLRDFLHGFDFIRMKPSDGIVVGGVPPTHSIRFLGTTGTAYAAYLRPLPDPKRPPEPSPNPLELTLVVDLPAGSYSGRWLVPGTGAATPLPAIAHAGGRLELTTIPFREDLALELRAERP